MTSTASSCVSISRAQLAREAAYQLLARPLSNAEVDIQSTEHAIHKDHLADDKDSYPSRKETSLGVPKHDTMAYLLVAMLGSLWLATTNYSTVSRNEACVAAGVDLFRVAAVTVIIYALDWYSTSLIGCNMEASEHQRPSLARTFALSLLFVMAADCMRVDTRSVW